VSTNFKPPTNRELIAARVAQAPAAPSPAPNTLRPVAEARAEYNANYKSRYLDEVAPSTVSGRLLKFKDGGFHTTDDGKPVDKDAEFILLAPETQIGWIRFNGEGETPDRVMGLLFDGFEMPSRESLGDTDPAQWEVGLNGHPADPWSHQQSVVLQNTTTHELFTFTTTSLTGRRAVGEALKHYQRMQRTAPGELPIVRLSTGGFNHKDSRVGWVEVPKFIITGRTSKTGAAKPELSDSLDRLF
jgi:hypothetical protein